MRRKTRKALIGPDHDPYNRASATGECGKGVHTREACGAGSAVRPVRSHTVGAVHGVHTVERSVR